MGDLQRTITIVIAEFRLLPKENKDCINRFRWYNIANGAMLTDAQEIVTIETPKLAKDDDGTRSWQWLRFLELRREDEMEEAVRGNVNMKNVVVSLRKLSADETERRLAEARDKEMRDRVAERQYGEEIGQARGEEIGQTRGEEIGKLLGKEIEKQETGRRMKEKKFPTEDIVAITGLTVEEIDAL